MGYFSSMELGLEATKVVLGLLFINSGSGQCYIYMMNLMLSINRVLPSFAAIRIIS